MLFNSLSFAVFLPVVFAVYWLLPARFRWAGLLIASYYFYMSWNAAYIWLIFFTTLVSYLCALFLERTRDKGRQKWILGLALAASLGLLFFFKYFNFASESVSGLLRSFSLPVHPVTLKLLLPVGISFYTFQTLGYVIDVCRGEIRAERHFGRYAAFVSFFPQLVAGPIERSRNLLPQMDGKREFSYDQATYGLKLMAWGFYKKIIVADSLAQYVDRVYNSPRDFHGFTLVMATVLFAIQIYCDFSGYSDIAIGTAKLFGIDLMTNFKSPYFSSSIREFWQRWHISLSSWFRDYVYIPLGGNRGGKWRNIRNLMVTFLVSGLWHGANWTFLAWGGIHGAVQVLEKQLHRGKDGKEGRRGFKWLLQVTVVFAICCFAWIFFRADNMGDAFYVIQTMLQGISRPVSYFRLGLLDMEIRGSTFLRICGIMLPVFLYDYASLKTDVMEWIGRRPAALRWTIYIAWVDLMLIYCARYGLQNNAFIYFQF